jgi:hypothetical protein
MEEGDLEKHSIAPPLPGLRKPSKKQFDKSKHWFVEVCPFGQELVQPAAAEVVASAKTNIG